MSFLGIGAPVTATFALPFAAYYILLRDRAVIHQLGSQAAIEQQSPGGAKPTASQNDLFLIAARKQCKFIDGVPLALALAGLIEINGGPVLRIGLSWVLGIYFVSRVLYVRGVTATGRSGIWTTIGNFVIFAVKFTLVCGTVIGAIAFCVAGPIQDAKAINSFKKVNAESSGSFAAALKKIFTTDTK